MEQLLSPQWCHEHGIALLSESAPYRVAVPDDCDEFLLEKIRMELNASIMPQKMNSREIRRIQLKDAPLNEKDFFSQGNATSTSWEAEPVVNLVESIIDDALEGKATDIHLEPDHGHFRIRLRQDGLLNEYRNLPLWASEPVLVRLKILAEIDITDKRIPHDGSFTFCGYRHSANIRVSTLPVQGGEKCVLRLLPVASGAKDSEQASFKELDSLHLSKPHLLFLRHVFNSPQGIFLVTGPTGSGKTTTLHAGLQEILSKQVNVTTIEDPIEYPLEGAAQVQVNEKCNFTFATALRALLRQDPDVILVGEIRDPETAQIALRAAQTGHLVLSTLHTNSAKATFARLEDLGVPKNSLQESLLGIMAQRLVRCRPHPDQNYSGRTAVIEILKSDGEYVDGTLHENAQRLVQAGITDNAEIRRVFGNLTTNH